MGCGFSTGYMFKAFAVLCGSVKCVLHHMSRQSMPYSSTSTAAAAMVDIAGLPGAGVQENKK